MRERRPDAVQLREQLGDDRQDVGSMRLAVADRAGRRVEVERGPAQALELASAQAEVERAVEGETTRVDVEVASQAPGLAFSRMPRATDLSLSLHRRSARLALRLSGLAGRTTLVGRTRGAASVHPKSLTVLGVAITILATSRLDPVPRQVQPRGDAAAEKTHDVSVQVDVQAGDLCEYVVSDVISWHGTDGTPLPPEILFPGPNTIHLPAGKYTVRAWEPNWLTAAPGGTRSEDADLIVGEGNAATQPVTLHLKHITGLVLVIHHKSVSDHLPWVRATILPLSETITPALSPAVKNALSQVKWDVITDFRPLRAYELNGSGSVFPVITLDRDGDPVVGPVVKLEEGKMKYVIMDVDP